MTKLGIGNYGTFKIQIMVQAQSAVDMWMQLFIEYRAPAVHQEASTFL